jgi:hypothetical protein
MTKFATWNLSQGLLNKKDLVPDELKSKDIDICRMQETEINQDVPADLLNNSPFLFEYEKGTGKKKVGLNINKTIIYKHREDLELDNLHLIIVDATSDINFCMLSLYPTFRPPDGSSPISFLVNKLP